jgi:hypothetical protein
MLSNSSSDLSGYETMVTPGGSNLFCCSTIVFDALGHIEQNFKPYLGYSSIIVTINQLGLSIFKLGSRTYMIKRCASDLHEHDSRTHTE